MEVRPGRRAPRSLIDGFRGLSTSTVSTALEDRGIYSVVQTIKPICAGFRFVGSALTVKESTGVVGTYERSDFKLSAVMDAAGSGDVIAIDNAGHQVSTWGGMASLTAHAKGVAGLLVDGGVRDLDEIREHGFPVFARHVVCTSARTRIRIDAINVPVKIDNILVRPGDVLVGDGSGVVVVPLDIAEEVLRTARDYAAKDAAAMRIIKAGGPFDDALQTMLKAPS